jgi:SnoaL-like protein
MFRAISTFAAIMVIAATSLHAQSSPLSTLSALDYFEIQQLVAKYARAIDTCSNNGYDYADLFTADGVFASEQNGKSVDRAQGRERSSRKSPAAARAGARTSAGSSRV